MKVMIFGGNGQLGRTLLATTPPESVVDAPSSGEVDVTDSEAVRERVTEFGPDVILNAAAYTAVDAAESNNNCATSVNVDGARSIARAAASSAAQLIYLSTDFVFDGYASRPYRTDSVTAPMGVYGKTKRLGELASHDAAAGRTCVVRTSWLYSQYGNNFVKTMLALMASKSELRVINDQTGAPTWTGSLAAVIWSLAKLPKLPDYLHCSDGGETTWFGFAEEVQRLGLKYRLLENKARIIPIPSSEYPTAAQRPAYSVLDCSETFALTGSAQEPWQHGLETMMKSMVA